MDKKQINKGALIVLALGFTALIPCVPFLFAAVGGMILAVGLSA